MKYSSQVLRPKSMRWTNASVLAINYCYFQYLLITDRRKKRAPNSRKRRSKIPQVLLESDDDEEDNEVASGEDVSEDEESAAQDVPDSDNAPIYPQRRSQRLSSPKRSTNESVMGGPVGKPDTALKSPKGGKTPDSVEKIAASGEKSKDVNRDNGNVDFETPVKIASGVSASTGKVTGSSRKSSRIAAKVSGGDKHASKPWIKKSFRLVGGDSGIESVKLTPFLHVKDITDQSEIGSGDQVVGDKVVSHTLVLSLGTLSSKPVSESKKGKKQSTEWATTPRRSRRNKERNKDEGIEETTAFRALNMVTEDTVKESDKTDEEGYYRVTVDMDEGKIEEAAEAETVHVEVIVKDPGAEREADDHDVIEKMSDEKGTNSGTESVKEEQNVMGSNKRKQTAEEEQGVRFALMDENNMYVCDNCNNKFETFAELEKHELTHTEQGRRKRRNITSTGREGRGKFQKLQPGPLLTGNEKQNEDGLWECVTCGKAFEKLLYLERHMRAHTDVFKCEDCGKRFARNESLQKHRCTGNPDTAVFTEKRHFCEFCGAGFISHTYLLRHMASHTDDFKCEFCEKKFGSKNALRQHIVKCKPDIVSDKKYADELFPCDQCDKVFSRKATLLNHMKLHSGDFKCETCKKCFSSIFTLERHTAEGNCEEPSEDTEDGKYPCKECDRVFNKKGRLNLHVAQDHTEMALFCTMCEKSYVKKEDLLKHMIECAAKVQAKREGRIQCVFCDEHFTDPVKFRHHFQEHTHPFKCDKCSKMFLRQTGLDNHNCDVTKIQPDLCPICGKEIRTSRYMEKHIRLAHGEEQQCPVCERTFKRADHLLNHKCVNKDGVVVMEKKRKTREQRQAEGVHDDRVCPICGKTFSVQSNLTKHMKSHGEKTVPCPQCGKLFYTPIAVKAHIKHVHEESHNVCQYCGKVMKCKNSLYGHITQYHQNTVTLYECDICGKQFRQKGNVKKHQLIHSDKKTYSCKFCERKFRFPEQHRRHELWHSGPKHQCTFCNKKFVMPFELKKHLRVYHSGLVYACKYCNLECRYLHTMKRHLERRHSDCEEWHADPIKFIKGLVGRAGDPAHAELPAPPSGRTMSTQPPTYLRTLATGNANYMIVEDDMDTEEEQEGGLVAGEDVTIPGETRFIITNTDGRTTLAQLPDGATITTDDIEVSQVGISDNLGTPSNLHIDASTMDSILAGFGTGTTSSATGEHPYIVAEVQGLEGSDGTGATQTIIIQTDAGDGQFHGIEVGSADIAAHEVAAALQGLNQQQTTVQEVSQSDTAEQEVASSEQQEESVTIIGDITQSDGQSVPIALQGTNVSEGEGYIIVPMKQVLEEPK